MKYNDIINKNILNIASSIYILILGIILFFKNKNLLSIVIILLGIVSIINHYNHEESWWIYDLNSNSKIHINEHFITRILDYWLIITTLLLVTIKYYKNFIFWIGCFIILLLTIIPYLLNLKKNTYTITHTLIHLFGIIGISYLEFTS